MGINEPAARLRPRTEPSDPAETGVLIVDLAALADNWRTMLGWPRSGMRRGEGRRYGLARARDARGCSAGCRTCRATPSKAKWSAVANDATIYAGRLAWRGATSPPPILYQPGLLGEIDEWAATGRSPKPRSIDTG
jgi:alanine racemase